MSESVLATVEIRCYLTVVLCGPRERQSAGSAGFIDTARVVAVEDFFMDEVIADSHLELTEVTAPMAKAIADREALFRALFEV